MRITGTLPSRFSLAFEWLTVYPRHHPSEDPDLETLPKEIQRAAQGDSGEGPGMRVAR